MVINELLKDRKRAGTSNVLWKSIPEPNGGNKEGISVDGSAMRRHGEDSRGSCLTKRTLESIEVLEELVTNVGNIGSIARM